MGAAHRGQGGRHVRLREVLPPRTHCLAQRQSTGAVSGTRGDKRYLNEILLGAPGQARPPRCRPNLLAAWGRRGCGAGGCAGAGCRVRQGAACAALPEAHGVC